MTPEQRAAVRDSARYLRSVRPIDPGEVNEYVEGRPHPAAVRQVLREEAFDLGLVERDDGTFVPVSGEPVGGRVGTVERLPDRHARRLEDLLAGRYGADWYRGASGDRLRATIRRIKERYHRGRPVEYDEDAALGYAVYHLPGYYAAVQYVLSELAEAGLLPRQLRVVDVGAGVGGPAMGLFDLLPDDAVVDYHAVEPSAAADVLESLVEGAGPNVHATVHRETAEAFDPPNADLVLLANVLSELDAPAEVVERYADALVADGSVVALAPADLETSTGLREVERSVVDGLSVYSPTVRLWPGCEPSGRCWSFDVRPDLAVPGFQRRLDRDGGATGEFVNADVQFSYAILRRDGRRRVAFDPDPGRLARMADAERHATERIDLAAVKLSHDLAGDDRRRDAGRESDRRGNRGGRDRERGRGGREGGNPVFLVGDGSERVDHYAVLTRETGLNHGLVDAGYGDLLAIERALLLWNDDEGAYNLVVDDESVVDRLGP